MKPVHIILQLLILYEISFKANATVFEFFRHAFGRSPSTNASGPISKRDVTGMIEKTSKNCELQPCNEDQIMVYLAELQAINPESIINLSTYDELINICREVSESLDKVDQYLKSCEIMNDKSLYIQLIKGVDKLYSVLCEDNSKIRKGIQENFSCLKTLHEDFETCFGPPDWTENLNKKEICLAYKDIADCYYIKTASVCGKKAAGVMKSLVKAVVNAIINVRCTIINVNPHVDAVCNGQGRIQRHFVYFIVVANIIYIIN